MEDTLPKKNVEDILPKNKETEEEFQNFMHRVTHVETIINKLTSNNKGEQQQGFLLADQLLKCKTDVNEKEELKVTSSRTVINKNIKDEPKNPNEMSQEAFMRSIEIDVKKRSEDRKIRNERAETYKKIGNNAFKEENYEKAITYFSKAIEQRKDSTVLWNNRALAYMKLELYEKALEDFAWALKVDDSNLKSLLNITKCHKFLKNNDKCQEYISLAKERQSRHLSFIEEFEKEITNEL